MGPARFEPRDGKLKILVNERTTLVMPTLNKKSEQGTQLTFIEQKLEYLQAALSNQLRMDPITHDYRLTPVTTTMTTSSTTTMAPEPQGLPGYSMPRPEGIKETLALETYKEIGGLRGRLTNAQLSGAPSRTIFDIAQKLAESISVAYAKYAFFFEFHRNVVESVKVLRSVVEQVIKTNPDISADQLKIINAALQAALLKPLAPAK
jgi:hypothetical protein